VNVENVIIVPGGQTGLTLVLNRGNDRAMLTHLGLISALSAEDIPDALLRQTRHLHIASYFLQESLQPGLPRLLARARALGLTTSLDTNYDPTEQWRGFDALLPHVNILLPNEAEAKSLSRADTFQEAAQRLSSQVETLAVKLGAEGAWGSHNGQQVRVASLPVRVVDTVGAGDSFNAGFLYASLSGWGLEKSLRVASICGALSTRQPGGIAGQPSPADLSAYL
jgi:sugar/nucleoside kinase (ribokinase family)